YTVYFKASADNHVDYASSFAIKIDRADIELTVNVYTQEYGNAILTSDQIVDNMLKNTSKVLDAEDWAGISDYIKQICTFRIDVPTGSVSTGTSGATYANKGSYSVTYTKNSSWNDRIATISFVNNGERGAYQVKARPIQVEWTQQDNMYYDGLGEKRPSAGIKGDVDFDGISIGLSRVGITGAGIDGSGNVVELENGEAIYAGTYEAYINCTNSNFEVDESTRKCNFTILRRPITVVLQDRERTYASKGTATDVWKDYTTTLLQNNSNNEVYVATVDSNIGSRALVDSAIRVFEITNNATDNDYTTTSNEAEKYFKVNTYELTLNLINKNYELTSNSVTTADFVIKPAKIDFDLQSLATKTYNGQAQNLTITNNNTVITLQGYEANHRDGVVISYSSTGNAGSYTTTPLTRKDVGTTTVYYQIEASNHTTIRGSLTATVSASNVRVNLTTANVTATYGDEVPTSAELVAKLGITLTWTNENNRIADIYDRLAFVVEDVLDRMADAGTYSLTHEFIGEEVGKSNINVTYVNDAGLDSYTILPKTLYIEWKQSGESWAENGMEYYYSSKEPVIKPVAPDTYDGKENVVVIDADHRDNISLAEIELSGSVVGTYAGIKTNLVDSRNLNNYVIDNPTATFKIVPRIVEIHLKNQTAVYGRAKDVAFYTALLSDKNPNAKWAYPDGVADTAKFLSDDYSAFRLVSEAHTPSAGFDYKDAGTYDIEIEVINEEIASNYDVRKITEGAPEDRQAKFIITPAQIHFGARTFNIDFDKEEEHNYVTKKQMRDTIDTTLKTSPDEFTIYMSDLFKAEDAQYGSIDNVTTWVPDQTREITKNSEIGEYYVWVRITHHCPIHADHSNYETFETRVQVNIISGWVSIKIGKGIENAQYGDPVLSSLDIFKGLTIAEVDGIKKDGSETDYKTTEEALEDLEQLVKSGAIKFYVLESDATTPMEQNASFGEYTIEIEVVDKTGEYKYFRFLDPDGKANADKPTTNIDAYKVGQRIIGITWGVMDEVYGEHSETSASHTYTVTNVMTRGGKLDDVQVTVKYQKKVDGKWVDMAQGEHARNVGEYNATVTEVSHPDYKLPETDLYTEFRITERTITVVLNDRKLTYGDANTHRDNIDTYLNTRSSNFDRLTESEDSEYKFLDKNNINNIVRFRLEEYTLDSNYKYLPVKEGGYSIFIDTINSNYKIIVKDDIPGILTIEESRAMSYARDIITTKVYQGKEISVVDPLSKVFEYIRFTSGDGAELLKNLNAQDVVEYKQSTDPDSKYSYDYKVKDAGDYVINIKVNVPNYAQQVFTATLKVSQAYVVINMTATAEKEYGDTEQDLIDKDGDDNVTTLSDWLKKHCNITLTTYTEKDGDPIVVEGVDNDFEFKVVAKGTGDSTALVIGAESVGTYRIYHVTDKAVLSNYTFDYYQAPDAESKCNADAYKINPKKIDAVDWVTSGYMGQDTHKFEFSGNRPSITATITLIDGTKSVSIPLKHILKEGESSRDDEEVVNAGKYTAIIDEIDISDSRYEILGNYDFSGHSFDYEIVRKNVTVIIDNQSFVYGTENTKVGGWQNHTAYVRADGKESFVGGQPITLSIAEKVDGEYYPVGTYSIVGKCNSDNYNVTFKGQTGSNSYATFNVTEADMFITTSIYSVAYPGKALSVDVKSILAKTEGYNVKGDTLWDDAIVTYKQEDGSYIDTLPVIDSITDSDGVKIDYRVQ
ncbi:MAG: hypothetical protein HDT43_10105, partial [Ruminococcaceae bacterium]|nr:hypothetical protein [Oscillospiraceae bacterium]